MKSIVIALPQPAPEETQTIRLSPIQRLGGSVRRYGVAITITLFLLSGLVFGAVRSSRAGFSVSGVDRFLIMLPETLEGKTPVMVFADSFSVSFLFAAALCFLALTPSGIAAVPALVFFKGYELGVMCGALCSVSGFTGLAYYISVVFAGAFLSSLAVIYFSQYCIEFSFSILLAIFGHSFGCSLREKLRGLVLNGSYSLIMLVFASLTDTLLYNMIGRLFVSL